MAEAVENNVKENGQPVVQVPGQQQVASSQVVDNRQIEELQAKLNIMQQQFEKQTRDLQKMQQQNGSLIEEKNVEKIRQTAKEAGLNLDDCDDKNEKDLIRHIIEKNELLDTKDKTDTYLKGAFDFVCQQKIKEKINAPAVSGVSESVNDHSKQVEKVFGGVDAQGKIIWE